MEPNGDKRRIAAILVADMVGYSRLMEAVRRALARLKAKNNGRIIKNCGDGMLAEFASVLGTEEML